MTVEEDLKALREALAKGEGEVFPASEAVGFPMRVESIEQSLRHTTYRMEGAEPAMRLTMLSGQQEIDWARKPTPFGLWRELGQDPNAYNTVEEYDQLVGRDEG